MVFVEVEIGNRKQVLAWEWRCIYGLIKDAVGWWRKLDMERVTIMTLVVVNTVVMHIWVDKQCRWWKLDMERVWQLWLRLYVASVARTGENRDSVNLQGHLVMTGIDICTDIRDDMEFWWMYAVEKGLKYNECLLEIILKVISTVWVRWIYAQIYAMILMNVCGWIELIWNNREGKPKSVAVE